MSRRLAWLAGAVAAALLLWLLWPGAAEAPTPPAALAAGPVAARPDREAPRPMLPPRQPITIVRAPATPPLPPIIDEVRVEKPEVCRGEENLVSVVAHTEGHAEDAWLHYMVVDATGAQVPLRLTQRGDEATRGVQRQVIVFGRDNVSTVVPLPAYQVKDCDPDRQLFVEHRLMANTENEYELSARLRDVAAATPMRPVRFRWDFGDGTTGETTDPFAVHDYGARAEDTAYTQLLVTCEAVGADGETVLGRTSLQLMNPAFEELSEKGLVRISTSMTPRFPTLDEAGRVLEQIHVWHHRADPVTIQRVIVTRNFLPGPDGARPAPTTEEVSPESLMGTRVIPPAGLTFGAVLDTGADKELASVDYLLEGVSAEGYPAHGNFSMMRPPPRPTREASHPVVSEYLKAKILRAREYLHQDYVTDEDLWRLERQGVFDDLKPESFPAPGAEPEPARPPAGSGAVPREHGGR